MSTLSIRTFAAVCTSLLTLAPSLGAAQEQISEDELMRQLCAEMIAIEYDVIISLSNYSSDMIHECTPLLPERVVVSTAEPFVGPSGLVPFGARLLERRNSWGSDGSLIYIAVTNPYPVELDAILVEFNNGPCGREPEGTFQITFERPILADATMIAAVPHDSLALEADQGCLIIIGSTPDTSEAEDAASSFTALARAQQWHEAALMFELATRVGEPLSFSDVARVRRDVEADVRALPAVQAIANRDGYDLLLTLDPENQDFAVKVERYQEASLGERGEMSMMQALAATSLTVVETVAEGLSPERSRSQRDEAWRDFDGDTIWIDGTVSNVRPSGMLTNASIEMEVSPGISAVCFVKEVLNDSVAAVPIGSPVRCEGTLFDYTIIFDHLSLLVREAEYDR